jgi:hypothetical protein
MKHNTSSITRKRRRGMYIGCWWESQPEGKRPSGKPADMWVDSIEMSLREVGWGGKNWIGLAQDRDQWMALVNTAMNFRVLQNVGDVAHNLGHS